ncbi:MAG: UDP-N-acetylmuramoyl-L-alanine--D-glutamate ligase [candidate division Zixibacteria bacterium HGW-Zixibacteria-1]|nr:MAG: UDP-N-acetylmuramoyl-L-alanine--D-glutamate ligase [candidate division Zixibacteria bacterium HGW-Zixibacteria-1]
MTVKDRVKGRKVGIVGMARSGVAAAKLARRLGGVPFVSDVKSADKLEAQIHELKTFGIEFETGGHTDRLLNSDFVIVSPGIPQETEIIRKIVASGIPIFSEIEFASWFCKGKIIAITGSNGKTTTTTLIGAILDAAGFKNKVCGNIGFPFSEAVLDIPEDGYAVLEVSNFQLELIEEFCPYIAMILNITPDHLDRYENFDGYKKAKYRITENQKPADFLILNADDPVIEKNNIASKARKIFFSTSRSLPTGVFQRGKSLVGIVGEKETDIIGAGSIRIPGPHNLQNSAAASLAALLAGVPPKPIHDALSQFPGVEHRLEDAGTIAGIKFVNDSKATNVDSVCFALRSFASPVILIAGGRDKGGDFDPIIKYGRGKVKEIILLGEAREKMFASLGKAFPVQFSDDMDDAVGKAFASAAPGEIVLLSPACASFDMYDNFEHRGRDFKRAVQALKNNNHVVNGIES